ncbi:MAG: endonuclease/exonuclease/phosphatase family protein [Bacteroidales bacterium]
MKKRVLGVLNVLLIMGIIACSTGLKAQGKKEYQVGVVGFYNLENLFDTIHDKGKRDHEYLPDGRNRWNTEKYTKKLKNMSKVIARLATDVSPDGCAVLGVSEIENKRVLEDLVATPEIQKRNYQIVQVEGPDARGIDVALLYNPKYFTVENVVSYPCRIPEKNDFRTRDQLLVSGKFGGEDMHFIVLHWPSRRGGEKRSRPLRNSAADVTRHIVDSLYNADNNAKVIVMGDLNDDPINQSCVDHLKAKANPKKLKDGEMYNTIYKYFKKGIGTLAYRDNWNNFDQIIISQGLLGKDYSSFKFYKSVIFNKNFLKNQEGRYKGYPKRTMVGGSWQGGYSDHFPVYTVLIKEKN